MNRKRPIQNMSASVHAKLKNKARDLGVPYNDLYESFVRERFLYRLARSRHAKESAWGAFLRRSRLTTAPTDLGEVISRIRGFLTPVAEAVIANDKFSRRWKPRGPWKD